jgi:hypothetical protein
VANGSHQRAFGLGSRHPIWRHGERNSAIAWARRNAIALLALFVALGGTGYAAATINGKLIKNGTIGGKKLKKDTLGGRQVKESK